MASDNGTSVEPTRKRLRTSHACDVCRSRKIRCNGNNPCAGCEASNSDCTYGSEANPRGKSDLILDGVLRVERFLQEMKATIVSSPSSSSPFVNSTRQSQAVASPVVSSSADRGSFSHSPGTEVYHPLHQQRTPLSEPHSPNNFENAVLDSMHTSTTESVLQWPHFDVFPSLRHDYVSIFQLEQSRPPFQTRNATMYPYATAEDVDSILDSFEHAVNFWYPTMSSAQLQRARVTMTTGAFEEDGDGGAVGCLALLTMALGCASQVTSGLAGGADLCDEERKRRAARRAMGDRYFDSVLKRLHVAHTDVSATATHCLFFVAMYFAFLCRPLQAWEYINAAAAKCLLLLSYPPAGESLEDQERIRRIFWSCYILESDHLAELSGLPQSGIARIESSIPLPGAYHTHSSPAEEEQSSLYFLACISMRRLLNRVHQLLYARGGAGASLNTARFPFVVAELDGQLEDWREVLPPAFAFSVGTGASAGAAAATTERGAFLRQRYFTCRSVIYRPYLMWMLSGEGGAGYGGGLGANSTVGSVSEEVLTNCRACLDACLLHILNLRGFGHTVLVDTWICSLSMAGAMLALLAACRMPILRSLIGPEVLAAGTHLQQLLRGWQQVLGGPSSPSVDQGIRIICDADTYIGEVYRPGAPFPPIWGAGEQWDGERE